MSVLFDGLVVVLGAAAIVAVAAVVRPSDLDDRIIALDVALMAVVGLIAVRGAQDGDALLLVVPLVLGLLGVTATMAASRLIRPEDTEPAAPLGPLDVEPQDDR